MNEIMLIDGHESAFIGTSLVWSTNGEITRRAIYDGELIAQNLCDSGMDEDEVREFISFNIEGAYVGESTPVIVWRHEIEDIEDES